MPFAQSDESSYVLNPIRIQIVKLHLQILEEGHDERMMREGEALLVEANKRNHITERRHHGLLDARNQPSVVVKQSMPSRARRFYTSPP
jgi:hypothetical protein